MRAPHALILLALTLSGCDGCPEQFRDEGLMEATAPSPGAQDVDGDGRLGDLVWRSWVPPVEVQVSPELPAADHAHLTAAIAEVNDLVGSVVLRGPFRASDVVQTKVEVLEGRPPAGVAYVYVHPGLRCAAAPQEACDGQTELLHHTDTGTAVAAVVRLAEKEAVKGSRRRAVKHELLHVLGLAHDPDLRSSLMHPAAPEGSAVTDHDTKLLRRLYGRTAE